MISNRNLYCGQHCKLQTNNSKTVTVTEIFEFCELISLRLNILCLRYIPIPNKKIALHAYNIIFESKLPYCNLKFLKLSTSISKNRVLKTIAIQQTSYMYVNSHQYLYNKQLNIASTPTCDVERRSPVTKQNVTSSTCSKLT